MNREQIDRISHNLFDAPCVFCGYNGPNYYQAGTHDKKCPWHRVGGYDERIESFIELARKNKIAVK